MNIDVHNHAIPQAALDVLGADDVFGVSIEGGRWRGGTMGEFAIAPTFFSADAKLAQLRAAGLEGAVLSVAPMIFYYHVDVDPAERLAREANRGLAEMCAQAADRLWWMATVPMQDPDRAVAVLEHAAAEGCVGVEIATSVRGVALDDARHEPFWAAADRLGLPVMLHPAYNTANPALAPFYLKNVIGHQFETTVAAERLICSGVLDRHPGVRVVLVHGGGYLPYQLGRLEHARGVREELAEAPQDPWSYAGRIVCDIITHDPQALSYLVSRMGAANVVMGTDFPFDMAEEQPMALLREAVDADAVRTVAERVPAQLFGLPV
jgi:aminocarboxymuconate-semialdehyde decarboxylase